MSASSLRPLVALAAAGLALGACTDGYGYSGLSLGYGSSYYDDGYYDGGYGYGSYGSPYWGWWGDYYYPGTGYYVYDRYNRPYRWNDRQRSYWENRGRQWRGGDRRSNWDGYRRDWNNRDGNNDGRWQGRRDWNGNNWNGSRRDGAVTPPGAGTGGRWQRGDGTGQVNRPYRSPQSRQAPSTNPTPRAQPSDNRGSGRWGGRNRRD